MGLNGALGSEERRTLVTPLWVHSTAPLGVIMNPGSVTFLVLLKGKELASMPIHL